MAYILTDMLCIWYIAVTIYILGRTLACSCAHHERTHARMLAGTHALAPTNIGTIWNMLQHIGR